MVPAGRSGGPRVGDRVRRADGSFGWVEAKEVAPAPQVIYNLTVAGAARPAVEAGTLAGP